MAAAHDDDGRKQDDGADRPEFEPIPEPPPPPPIPPVLTRPVERPESMTRKPATQSDTLRAVSGYAAAFSFIGTVLGFGALGWVVDYFAGTGPWMLVAGLALGFIGGTIKMVRDASR
jgi:hypothetical protein